MKKVEWRHVVLPVELIVSSDGRIKSGRTGETLKPAKRRGYDRIRIYHSVHVLVAQAFVPNPDDNPIVNHKNNDRRDNTAENLEWCTHVENVRHAHKQGFVTYRHGSQNGAAKLTESQVEEIRRIYSLKKTKQADLAERYGVSQRTISLIVRKEKWRHV